MPNKLIFKDPNIRIRRPKSLISYLPREMRPFEYKTRRSARVEADFLRPAKPKESLTGFVHGEKASDLEERWALALDQLGLEYIFLFEVSGAFTLPTEEKVIDFVVNDGGLQIPIEVGAKFFHASPSQQEKERDRENIINPILQLQGIHPLGDPLYRVEVDHPISVSDALDIAKGMFVSV